MRLISSEVIIDWVKSRFRPIDFNWEGDSFDIIGEAIQAIGTKLAYEFTWKTLTVKDHKVRVPQEAEKIEFVTYNGQVLLKSINREALNPNNNTPIVTSDDEALRELESITKQYESLETLINKTTDLTVLTELQEKQDKLLQEMIKYAKSITVPIKNITVDQEYWQEQNHVIVTSFESGEITVYYNRYFLTDDYYPMIPDNHLYKQAVYYYFISRLMEMGYTSDILKYVDAINLFESFKDKAKNNIKAPTVEDHENLARLTVRMKFNPNLGRSNFKGL